MENKYDLIGIDYYQPVFISFTKQYAKEIHDVLTTEPKKIALKFWQHRPSNIEFSGQEAWDEFNKYLMHIERLIYPIINRHSCYYWIHIYRRIGVSLYKELRGNTNSYTLGLVRNILETAFSKYGNLSIQKDLQQSSTLTVDEILGGNYKKYWLEMLRGDNGFLKKHFKFLQSTNQWVITDFNYHDFINIYRLEGLAYEYWWATAKMRAIGKGIKVVPDKDLIISEVRGNMMDRLIHNYDDRINKGTFQTSAIGVGFFEKESEPFTIVTPNLNVNNIKFPNVFPDMDIKIAGKSSTNFILTTINLLSYIEAHDFIEQHFFNVKGFHLCNYVAFFMAIANKWLSNILIGDERERMAAIINKHQRAYETTDLTIKEYCKDLSDILKLTNTTSVLRHGNFERESKKILLELSLKKNKQSRICLWSGGPRYIFIPYKNMNIVDLVPINLILHNLFYKIVYDQQSKGKLFEDNFRTAIKDQNLNLLSNRKLKNNDSVELETDAAIKIGNTLILCECRAMEKPMDFEIGNIRTINKRIDDFEDKLSQVFKLEKFIKDDPIGRNYDFSWVNNIISIVVSPFIEWIWDYNNRYFIDDETPRILSGNEAIILMKAIMKKQEND